MQRRLLSVWSPGVPCAVAARNGSSFGRSLGRGVEWSIMRTVSLGFARTLPPSRVSRPVAGLLFSHTAGGGGGLVPVAVM
jgi:hypothetical protein